MRNVKTTISEIGTAGRPLPRRSVLSRGFSLVEVLLAIFILSMGLIMVASIFPVGAEWTRQNAEETIALGIAENAFSVVQSRMDNSDFSAITSTTVQGVPTFLTKFTANERAYKFGSGQPFPVSDPTTASYFWTLMARRTPSSNTSGSTYLKAYDVYILVFKKGAVENVFGQNPVQAPQQYTRGATEYYMPYTVSAGFGSVPIGGVGIGVNSGTVFRSINTSSGAKSNPGISGGENVFWGPPSDIPAGGTKTGSPLVYVYQTTLTF